MTTLVTGKDREEELIEATRPTTPEEIKRFIQKNGDQRGYLGAGDSLHKPSFRISI